MRQNLYEPAVRRCDLRRHPNSYEFCYGVPVGRQRQCHRVVEVGMRLFEGTPFDRPPKCERCGELESQCTCPPGTRGFIAPQKQTARLAIEKRKKGKVVTVIRGLAAEANDLPALLSRLQSRCGAGGTVRDDCLEIQGEHLDRIREYLLEIGYRVKG